MRRVVRLDGSTGGVGWLGLEEYVEPVVRREVASYLGIPWEDVSRATSLDDELVATRDDVLAIGCALEHRLGVTLVEGRLARVRTYGDLVDAVMHQCSRTTDADATAAFARIRTTHGGRAEGPWVERVGPLTSYLVDTVASEAGWLGAGTRIDVWVAADTPWNILASATGCFARLSASGIHLRVHRENRRTH